MPKASSARCSTQQPTYFRHEFGKAKQQEIHAARLASAFPPRCPVSSRPRRNQGLLHSEAEFRLAARASGAAACWTSPEQTPEGIPYNVGIWVSPDGKSIIAALNPGGYAPEESPPTSARSLRRRLRVPRSPLINSPSSRRSSRPHASARARASRTGSSASTWTASSQASTPTTTTSAPATSAAVLWSPPSSCWKRSRTIARPSCLLHRRSVAEAVVNAPLRGQPGTLTTTGDLVKVGDGPLHVMMSAADQMFNAIPMDMTSRMPQYTGESRADQSLRRLAHFAGLPQATDHPQRRSRGRLRRRPPSPLTGWVA